TSALDATLARLDRLLAKVRPASSGLVMTSAGAGASFDSGVVNAGAGRRAGAMAALPAPSERRTALSVPWPAAQPMDLRPLVEGPRQTAEIRVFCDAQRDGGEGYRRANASVLLMTSVQLLGKLGRPDSIRVHE